MKNLKSSRGFAHQVLIMAVVVVAVIGGIGSYIYLRKSDAAISAASICGSGYQWRTKYPLYYGNGAEAPGKMIVLINKSTKKLCVVLKSYSPAYGVNKYMHVSMSIVNWPDQKVIRSGGSEGGYFKYYAGPLYVSYKNINLSTHALKASSTMYYSNKKADRVVVGGLKSWVY